MDVHDTTGDPQVHLRLPADNAYVAVLRTTATSLAARAEFTVDAIEDLRIAVGEAGALLLPLAQAGSDLNTRFTVRPGRLVVTMSTTPLARADVDHSSFAWQVLTTLTDHCLVARTDTSVEVSFEVSSCHPEY